MWTIKYKPYWSEPIEAVRENEWSILLYHMCKTLDQTQHIVNDDVVKFIEMHIKKRSLAYNVLCCCDVQYSTIQIIVSFTDSISVQFILQHFCNENLSLDQITF